ncbi:hypothetical protein [Natronoglycomyces albus]|uniref:Uncharacterized protein n=1 Tax=Natronoglycomyces albus TaxID=2811108 RepID=A0A895XMU4_9ACTN|nr:hypothetical protein [Natronoglycomyces albus]QSB04719.1 hypothetical protein JQS30_13210 [Natronoglycomyces albus]
MSNFTVPSGFRLKQGIQGLHEPLYNNAVKYILKGIPNEYMNPDSSTGGWIQAPKYSEVLQRWIPRQLPEDLELRTHSDAQMHASDVVSAIMNIAEPYLAPTPEMRYMKSKLAAVSQDFTDRIGKLHQLGLPDLATVRDKGVDVKVINDDAVRAIIEATSEDKWNQDAAEEFRRNFSFALPGAMVAHTYLNETLAVALMAEEANHDALKVNFDRIIRQVNLELSDGGVTPDHLATIGGLTGVAGLGSLMFLGIPPLSVFLAAIGTVAGISTWALSEMRQSVESSPEINGEITEEPYDMNIQPALLDEVGKKIVDAFEEVTKLFSQRSSQNAQDLSAQFSVFGGLGSSDGPGYAALVPGYGLRF